ncbi:uncharacterized protein LOC109821594 [Asparagus officinalis]|uniref:uncharacterized protein LOC109821594 n=1 Tax=Asparagus officinalis TaxID=4686 RepID=UPI00098DFA8C|nr:uncharacterized protein LOC109821594 [Asparagus officinalis]
MEEFNACINDCHMAPVSTSGHKYTWCNNFESRPRTWQTLDRFLQSSDLLISGNLSAHALHRSFSDHSPIILSWNNQSYYGPRLCRFQRMWTRHESFKAQVLHIWQRPRSHPPIIDICMKLKSLRYALKQWNSTIFGNIFTQKKDLENDILRIESSLQAQWDPSSHSELQSFKAKWHEIVIREEIFWKQKMGIRWLKEEVPLLFIRRQGSSAIHQAAINHLSSLLSSEPHCVREELLSLIPPSIQDDTNAFLIAPFSIDELASAASFIPADSAAGIDGFSSSFFTSQWRIVGNSILEAANDFLLHKKLPGVYKGFFSSSRGLRQGDPLSPSLFILAEEALSRGLENMISFDARFSTTKATCPSHLLFADDLIIFTNAARKSLNLILKIIDIYSQSSGQQLNLAKCRYYIKSKAPRERNRVIDNTLHFIRGLFPMTYLGVPIGPGQRKAAPFLPLVDRIKVCLQGWQGKLLSQAGRLILIKHVLSSMPIHLLSAISIPKSVLSKIESLFANFFWGSSEFATKNIGFLGINFVVLCPKGGLEFVN